jgi:hypothetical protein
MRRKKEPAPEGALLALVRHRLSDCDPLDVYRATRVTPGHQWAIAKGKTREPGVNTIERLYDYFMVESLGSRINL